MRWAAPPRPRPSIAPNIFLPPPRFSGTAPRNRDGRSRRARHLRWGLVMRSWGREELGGEGTARPLPRPNRNRQEMPELVLAGGVALVVSQRKTTPVVVANIAREIPVALPPMPATEMVPVKPGGVPETVSCAVDICHRPSYVVLAVSSPIRCCTSLTTQLPPVPLTCTQPDSEVMAEPARAFASARRASFVYPRYSGSATADRMPTIRMTMSSSTSGKPASRSVPTNALRIPFTGPLRDP